MRLAKFSSVRSSILLLQTKLLVLLQRDTEHKWDCNWLRKVRNPNSSLSRSGLNTTGRLFLAAVKNWIRTCRSKQGKT